MRLVGADLRAGRRRLPALRCASTDRPELGPYPALPRRSPKHLGRWYQRLGGAQGRAPSADLGWRARVPVGRLRLTAARWAAWLPCHQSEPGPSRATGIASSPMIIAEGVA